MKLSFSLRYQLNCTVKNYGSNLLHNRLFTTARQPSRCNWAELALRWTTTDISISMQQQRNCRNTYCNIWTSPFRTFSVPTTMLRITQNPHSLTEYFISPPPLEEQKKATELRHGRNETKCYEILICAPFSIKTHSPLSNYRILNIWTLTAQKRWSITRMSPLWL